MNTWGSRSGPQEPPIRAAYDGPLAETELEFSGLRFSLVRPADPDRLLDDPTVQAWNQRDDYMPYWAYLWPGALLLADVVAREPWGNGAPVAALEIGCGLGLAGLAALARGLHVCFTDYDAAPLEFIVRNAERNGFDPSRYATRLLDWRRPPQEHFPVILGSDVLYERKLVPLVASLLATMLAPGGHGLISCPGRTSAEGFPAAVAEHGLSCHVEPLKLRLQDRALRGFLYRVGSPVGMRMAPSAAINASPGLAAAEGVPVWVQRRPGPR